MVSYRKVIPWRGDLRVRLGTWCHRTGLLGPLRQMRAWHTRDLRILAYHRVLTVPDPDRFEFDLEVVSASAECFREQMQLLRRNFHPLSLGEVVRRIEAGQPMPRNAVAVTFDDGYDDNYRIAFPILRELGVPATFFVSTGHVDDGLPFAYDWLAHMVLHAPESRLQLPEVKLDVRVPTPLELRRKLVENLLDRLKSLDDAAQAALIAGLEKAWNMPRDRAVADCRPMGWAQLREMHQAGFEIGSHGVTHRMLAKLPQDELEWELCESKRVLERELGSAPNLLSYPVGGDRAFDARVIQAARAAGYRLACSYISGTNPEPATNRYALYRLPVERQMGPGWFAAMLSLPGLMAYPTARRTGVTAGES
ncbi:polysaccharide deacetylase family protein [Dyella lutea]|uniref:Polysaccharide deacetylase family protein n=1 Tax=Dyella lutea TaxID=2950441 RepID=A0ABT1F7J1_9GAMM|nr:polysaccharide deacetylase family protein [Dyella lutea]MCP1373343.1 polysaccharide deacetylase family protein [Dyella lutea]